MNYVVPPEKLADVWLEVEQWLAAAVNRNQGDENILDVLIAIARGQYGLWHEPGKWAAVIQIQRFPRQVVAMILYCGGHDIDSMREALEYGKRWAKENGVHAVRVFGRRGWGRVMGLEDKGVILQVNL